MSLDNKRVDRAATTTTLLRRIFFSLTSTSKRMTAVWGGRVNRAAEEE
jgi:hypothetical protein